MGVHKFKAGLPGYATGEPDVLNGETRSRYYAGGVRADTAEE